MFNEKIDRYIFTIVAFIAIASLFGNICQEYRLGSTRQQLNNVRMELDTATDKQREIRDIVRGTNEILSESFTTVEGIRSQIKCIRESYEEMEALLYDGTINCSCTNDFTTN